MTFIKKGKWLALLLVGVLVFSLTGCLGYHYDIAGTVDGQEISAGLYLFLQYTAHSDAQRYVEDVEKPVLKQQIDGISAKQWILNETEELCRRFVAVERICAERGITLSQENDAYFNELKTQYWDPMMDTYEENGIGIESLARSAVNEMLSEQLFRVLYTEGGERAHTDEEMRSDYEEAFAHLRYIAVPKTTAQGGLEKSAEAVAIAQTMLEELEGGTDFNTVALAHVEEVYNAIGRGFSETTAANSVYDSYIPYVESAAQETYPQAFLDELKAQTVGTFGLYELSNTIIIYEKIPHFEEEGEFDEMRETMVSDLYREDYNAYLANIYNEYPVVWETGARWFFRPEKIVSFV